ncbi:hypothetical protein OUZ56_007805 [Daphnia magna]|uniref:Uncharacterized protein n=1 Tax=Daphnia magna TaxID=35525 RepID=A0ABR0AB72_9CRUS|nr:hypothetical protein OUZ56_007805 [Daphnia magna]
MGKSGRCAGAVQSAINGISESDRRASKEERAVRFALRGRQPLQPGSIDQELLKASLLNRVSSLFLSL